MGRHRSLTVLLILGAWGAATDAAPPDGAAATPTKASRPPSRVPPVKYLKAGAELFNSGQYALAKKYIKAASMYRDQLTTEEQTILDAYVKEIASAPADTSVAPASATAAAPAVPSALPAGGPQQEGTAAQPAPAATEPSPTPVEAAVAPAETAAVAPQPVQLSGAEVRGPSTDKKQEARWLLQAAREEMRLGNYDSAQDKLDQSRKLNVRWGLFDDTPAKVAESLGKVRPKGAVADGRPRDQSTAKIKLKEARAALAGGEYEKAEAIALDLKSWGMNYGFFEDSPDKVAKAAQALRRRDSIRNAPLREQGSQGVYNVLVQEARGLMLQGKWNEAEVKARKAQRMSVVPSLTADRAEAVLHDLAMARAKQGPGGPPGTAIAAAPQSAVVAMEHEANDLLAKGDDAAATAKFAEAGKLQQRETGDPATADAPVALSAPAADPAVQKVDGQPEPVQTLPAAAVTGSRGEQLLAEARSLYSSGNYGAAKDLLAQAKINKLGVDAQADELFTQVALAEQGGALSLYESALDAVRKGDTDRARGLLSEVANMGGIDEGLAQKVQDLLGKLPREGAGKATATDFRNPANDAETLAAQKLNAEVGTKIAEARRLQETDPAKAIAIYEETLKTVKSSEVPETLARTMVRRLEVALELAKKDKGTFEVKMQDKAVRAENEAKRLRIFEADKAKKARMKEFMDQAQKAYADGDFVKAETFALKAQEVDPNEVAAVILSFKAKMERRIKRNTENRNAAEDGALQAFQGVDEAAIIDPDALQNGIKLPKNFKELTADRRRMNDKLQPRKNPKTLAIESKLNEPVSLNFDNQPFKEAMTFLANYTGLNIVVDPKALSEENITSESPVSLVAGNIKLKTALKLMLKPMGLNYVVDDEVLLITSPQASQSKTYSQPYYVGDLMMRPSHDQSGGNGHPANLNGKPIGNDPAAQPPGMTGGVSLANPGGSSKPEVTYGDRPKTDMTPLIQLITASIAPGSWRVYDPETKQDVSASYGMGGGFGGDAAGAGGDTQPIGSITPFFLSISLIIRHTAEIHDQVADLLRQLRRLQDLQVSIEVRFITVSDNFFEQIGVDFDFSIQSQTLGKHTTFAARNPATQLFGGNINGGVGGVGGGNAGGLGGGAAGGGGGLGGGGGAAGGGGGLGGGGGGGAGNLGGGLGGGGGAGGLGGGLGGGAAGGGGGGGGAVTVPAVIVNPFRDGTYGNKKPLVVGTSSGGIGSFTPDLQIPFTLFGGNANSLVAPSNAIPGSGAQFGIAFLSDLEVYLFMQAAQGDVRNNILQAPKVTTFNGAPASIINQRTINYVASVTPLLGFGAVAFQPNVAQFPDGVQLFVTPVVSADRRYVRMTLQPIFTALEGFDTFTSPLGAVGGGGIGGGSATINVTIQLPRSTTTTVSTTVTVPDGGTVLLGGVKRLTEERREYGVPILAKTPWINRLFRNIGIGRTTSSLMLMVTPRIIILEEEEEKLGIPTIAF